jgi:hypothetical protein
MMSLFRVQLSSTMQFFYLIVALWPPPLLGFGVLASGDGGAADFGGILSGGKTRMPRCTNMIGDTW